MTASLLVLGASYGLLIAARLSQAGHRVTVVCRSEEQDALLEHGARINFMSKSGGINSALSLAVRRGPALLAGELGVLGCDADVAGYDLVFLAFSEPQCAMPESAALLARIAAHALPVISLMNALPPPFLARLPDLPLNALAPAFAAGSVWSQFDGSRFTAASPDAQAIRLTTSLHCLRVTLPSNFKVAPFQSPEHQLLLQRLADDLRQARYQGQRLPVDLIAHDSVTVPLSKWPMLMTGNCRCVRETGGMVSIAEAVWHDLEQSRAIYEWVCEVVVRIGAKREDLIPFPAYASVAKSLKSPSSLARGIAAGARRVERVDKMVQLAGEAVGMTFPAVDDVVALIGRALERSAHD